MRKRDLEDLDDLDDQADAPATERMRRARDGEPASRSRGRLTEEARARLAREREAAAVDDGPPQGDRWSTWGDAEEHGPEPYPSWGGSRSQRIPVTSTNRMPLRQARSSSRRRPGCRSRRWTTGSSGLIRAHSSSLTSQSAISPPRPV